MDYEGPYRAVIEIVPDNTNISSLAPHVLAGDLAELPITMQVQRKYIQSSHMSRFAPSDANYRIGFTAVSDSNSSI